MILGRRALGRSLLWTLIAILLSSLTFAPPAQADATNTVTAFMQPMETCAWGRLNVMWCSGEIGAPRAISPDPAGSTPLSAGTGYALCWTTAAGQTLPVNASCAPTGSAIATGKDFTYTDTAAFPFAIDGSGGSGCQTHLNNAQNSFFIFSGSQGTCRLTISAPDAPGFTSTTAVFTLPVTPAPRPPINGSLTAASGKGRVGTAAALQSVTCDYVTQGDVFSRCPGVTLTWSVLSGRSSCRIVTNRDLDSEALGTVSVRFRAPGNCTVRGSYPAVAGQSDAYSTPVFTYQVRPRAKAR